MGKLLEDMKREPTQAELDEAVEKIRRSRTELLLRNPFYGNLALQLNIHLTTDLPTAAVAGLNVWFNPFFVNALEHREMVFLWSHEVMHLVFDHSTRFNGAKGQAHRIWNAAADFAINFILVRDKIGKMPSTIGKFPIADFENTPNVGEFVGQGDKGKLKSEKKQAGSFSPKIVKIDQTDVYVESGGLYDAKYSRDVNNRTMAWTSEEIFEDLMRNAKTIYITMDSHDGDDVEDDSDGDSDGQDGPGGEPSDKEGNGGKSRKMKDKADDGSGKPKEGDGEDEKDDEGQGGKKPNKLRKYKGLTDEERETVSDLVKARVMEAAMAAKQAGSAPGEIERLIEAMIEPKISWRDLLEDTMKSTIKNNRSFMRPSRKSWQSGIILPGFIAEDSVELHASIDASGSMTEEMLAEILGEIKGITDQFVSFKIHIWSFDTKCYNYQIFDENNVDDLLRYRLEGGGGTDIGVNWEFMKKNEIEPVQFVVFTDCYSGTFGEENYCDTSWIIFDNPTFTPPFGRYAYYTRGSGLSGVKSAK